MRSGERSFFSTWSINALQSVIPIVSREISTEVILGEVT